SPTLLEPQVHREACRPPAEIDLVAEEELALIEQPLALGFLIANLSADRPDIGDGESDPAEDHRTHRGAIGDEPVVVGDVVLEDELTHLAVLPVEGTDTDADIRLDAAAADGQEADGRGERHDSQLEILFELGAVVADLLLLDALHGALIDPGAEPRLQVLVDADEPFGPD